MKYIIIIIAAALIGGLVGYTAQPSQGVEYRTTATELRQTADTHNPLNWGLKDSIVYGELPKGHPLYAPGFKTWQVYKNVRKQP